MYAPGAVTRGVVGKEVGLLLATYPHLPSSLSAPALMRNSSSLTSPSSSPSFTSVSPALTPALPSLLPLQLQSMAGGGGVRPGSARSLTGPIGTGGSLAGSIRSLTHSSGVFASGWSSAQAPPSSTKGKTKRDSKKGKGAGGGGTGGGVARVALPMQAQVAALVSMQEAAAVHFALDLCLPPSSSSLPAPSSSSPTSVPSHSPSRSPKRVVEGQGRGCRKYRRTCGGKQGEEERRSKDAFATAAAHQELCLGVYAWLQVRFAASPELLFAVHSQGYPLALLSGVVEHVPAVQDTLSFLPHLVQHDDTKTRVFAVHLLSHLACQYPRHKDVAELGCTLVKALLHDPSASAPFIPLVLPALARLSQALSHLALLRADTLQLLLLTRERGEGRARGGGRRRHTPTEPIGLKPVFAGLDTSCGTQYCKAVDKAAWGVLSGADG